MSTDYQESWVEALTEIVSDVESLHQDSVAEIQNLTSAFFSESILICQVIRESYQAAEEADERGFINRLMQCSEDMGVAISSFNRGPAFQKDEMCHCMYRFISLLSQRIHFQGIHKQE